MADSPQKRKRRKREIEPSGMRKWRRKRRLLMAAVLACLVAMVAGSVYFVQDYKARLDIRLGSLEVPRWVKQEFITPNPYSRPQMPLVRVSGIVVHYVANPGTSALQNRSYFDGLADQQEEGAASASSHFIIGLDGEVIQIIPLDEVAYATSKKYNGRTISIECCHPDESGGFTDATYESLVKLTSWLCAELRLDEKDVIRHYDATGKLCPKYYVEHEDAWKQFRADIKQAVKESSAYGADSKTDG